MPRSKKLLPKIEPIKTPKPKKNALTEGFKLKKPKMKMSLDKMPIEDFMKFRG